MNDPLLKTQDATAFITQALDDFLRDHHLTLTGQQYEKLKKLLMVRLLDEDMNYETAYNHLTDIKAHRKDYEIDANAPIEAEEEMIRIIGAADVAQKEIIIENKNYKKHFVFCATLLSLLFAGFIGAQFLTYLENKNSELTAVITTDEEQTLKDLVQQLVTLEKQRGNDTTHNAIYADIKKLESVQNLGTATSYKKFNRAQYNATIEYLNERVKAQAL